MFLTQISESISVLAQVILIWRIFHQFYSVFWNIYRRVFLKIYKKPPTIRPLVIAEYSKPNATNDSPISHIHVEYSRTGKCYYDPVDAVTIVAGGIGEKYVKMTIESECYSPSNYAVGVYVKSKN